jgi:hypothetical protein
LLIRTNIPKMESIPPSQRIGNQRKKKPSGQERLDKMKVDGTVALLRQRYIKKHQEACARPLVNKSDPDRLKRSSVRSSTVINKQTGEYQHSRTTISDLSPGSNPSLTEPSGQNPADISNLKEGSPKNGSVKCLARKNGAIRSCVVKRSTRSGRILCSRTLKVTNPKKGTLKTTNPKNGTLRTTSPKKDTLKTTDPKNGALKYTTPKESALNKNTLKD